MKNRKFFNVMSVMALFATLILISSAPAECVEVLWMEDFESTLAGSLDGLNTNWQECESAHASVIQDLASHGGTKYLEVWATSMISPVPLQKCVEWGYDSLIAAHDDCCIELCWWMKYSVESNWKITLKGCNGQEVCTIGNRELGSIDTIDVFTDQGWQETQLILGEEVWTELILQLDFDASPVQYRLRLGDSTSWSGWYTLGIDAECFKLVEIFNNDSRTCYDDFSLSIVPEPATIGLLTLGALVLLRKRKT